MNTGAGSGLIERLLLLALLVVVVTVAAFIARPHLVPLRTVRSPTLDGPVH